MRGGRPQKARQPKSAGSVSCRSEPKGTDVEHSASGQDGEQRLLLLLAAPALLVVSALVLVPLAWLVGQSFYDDGLSLAHYQRIINEAVYWRSFGLTFRIAALVTIVCLLLGYPVAYAA